MTEKKTRHLRSLAKKGGWVKTHDQIRKQKKMWSNGVGERAFTSMKMKEFYVKIISSFRNICIFILYFQKLLVIEVFQQ